MQPLTLAHLLDVLAPYANAEQLLPQDASIIELLVTELLTDYYVDLTILKFLSRFFTPQSYDEMVEERNIEHLCGYIVCQLSPRKTRRPLHGYRGADATANAGRGNGGALDGASATANTSGGSGGGAASGGAAGHTPAHTHHASDDYVQYQIYHRKPSIILPNTYLLQYCCKDHYQALTFYRNQVSLEALFVRKGILTQLPFPPHMPRTWYENGITCLEEVIAKHHELQNEGKSLLEVILMMNGLSVEAGEGERDTTELVKMLHDFEIVERPAGPAVPPQPPQPPLREARANDMVMRAAAVFDDGEDDASDSEYVTTDKSFGGYVV